MEKSQEEKEVDEGRKKMRRRNNERKDTEELGMKIRKRGRDKEKEGGKERKVMDTGVKEEDVERGRKGSVNRKWDLKFEMGKNGREEKYWRD